MALKKIRKAEITLTSIVMILLILMGIFFGCYLYWMKNIERAGTSIDTTYSSSYANLTNASEKLDANVQEIKTNVEGITEAESTFQVAWNGLKGIGNTLKLPLKILVVAQKSWAALINPLGLPNWAVTLTLIAVFTLIVFLILKLLKGETGI